MLRRVTVGLLLAATLVTTADARPRHHHRGHFVCGAVQRAYFHIRDASFNLAMHWDTLPHTDAHPGAVVVQTRRGRALGGGQGGHVSRIVRNTKPCWAIVADDKGTYERNICKNLVAYVQP